MDRIHGKGGYSDWQGTGCGRILGRKLNEVLMHGGLEGHGGLEAWRPGGSC